MSKFSVLFMGICFLYNFSFGQNNYSIKGNVVDENNYALSGANIKLFPVERGVTSDNQGKFSISNLEKGLYVIEISFIGFKTHVDSIFLSEDKTYDVQLKSASMSLQEFVITDNYNKIRQKEESLNIEIVNDQYLKQNLSGSLMKSLERLPGVSTNDIGAGQSKPVIRGLGFNRVVIVENGIKHEGQQWGSDHGLEIDQYAIDNVEVIKGPSSLMYGSDAIGGVIDMKSKNIPMENSFGGSVDLSGKTNNDFLGTSIYLYGRKNWFFADIRATILDYGDYKVPTDSVDIYSYKAALYKNHLRNTAGKELNLNGSFGVDFHHFYSRFFVSSVNNHSGFFANAHGLEPRNVDARFHDKDSRDINYPYQEVNHFKVINKSVYVWRDFLFESNFGFQRNYRQEWSQYVSHGFMPANFPDSLNFNADLEREYEKYIYSENLKVSYQMNDKTNFIIGLNSDFQDNRIGGRGFIIPAFKQITVGGFAFVKHGISKKSIIQTGLRYDYGNINTHDYFDWYSSPTIINGDTTLQNLKRADGINRSFGNISWSIGYNYNPKRWSLKANFGKSFRMPIAKELAANGVNYHHFSYEVGNSNLSPEISYQLDLGVEFSSAKFAIGATPFVNYFSNYIFLNPTFEHDRLYGNGNQIYKYTQSEVFRYGGEIHSHYQLFKQLQFGVMLEYVYSLQLSGDKKGYTLPFSPPTSAILNVKYQKQRLSFLENLYFSVDLKITASQKNIVPPEEITQGYQVVNISVGSDLKIKNQKINVSIQLQNIFNTKYFNHTSYYRLINVPDPGRNLIINISIPFSGKIKTSKNN